MDAELRELYQQVIVDHHRKPRNYGALEGAHRSAEGYNPLCGDRVAVELKVDANGTLEHIAFTGEGCAICTASASLMTESLSGKSTEESEAIFEAFRDLVSGKAELADVEDRLDKLSVFAGVREFPVRIKCATLPWHTFHAALRDDQERITTE